MTNNQILCLFIALAVGGWFFSAGNQQRKSSTPKDSIHAQSEETLVGETPVPVQATRPLPEPKPIPSPTSESKSETTNTVRAEIYRAASEPSKEYGLERSGYAYATATFVSVRAGDLSPGQNVVFGPLDESGEVFSGTVCRLIPLQLDQSNSTGTVEVLIEIPDPASSLKRGTHSDIKLLNTGTLATSVRGDLVNRVGK